MVIFHRAARRTDAAIATEMVSHGPRRPRPCPARRWRTHPVRHAFELNQPPDIALANTQSQLLKTTEQLNEAKQTLVAPTNKVCSHLRRRRGYKSSELTKSSYTTKKHDVSNSRSSCANEPRQVSFHQCFIASEIGL